MKGVIAVDSFYGNTRRVAETLKDELEKAGHEVELLNLRTSRAVPSAGDYLFVGSPTRFGRMTGRSKRLLRKLDQRAWKDKPVVAFDTYARLPEDPKEREKSLRFVEPGAAGRLASFAEKRGLNVRSPPLRCVVVDMKGPLADGELDRVAEFARQFASSLKG